MYLNGTYLTVGVTGDRRGETSRHGKVHCHLLATCVHYSRLQEEEEGKWKPSPSKVHRGPCGPSIPTGSEREPCGHWLNYAVSELWTDVLEEEQGREGGRERSTQQNKRSTREDGLVSRRSAGHKTQ